MTKSIILFFDFRNLKRNLRSIVNRQSSIVNRQSSPMSFRTKKSLGQHFLTDQVVVYQIIDAIVAGKEDRVIEIGPGTGALTKWLAEKFDNLHAIELDQRAVNVLKEEVSNITIHQQDVLKVIWQEMVEADKNNVVIGNLPYYITTPILFDLLENRTLFTEAILMMQKENQLQVILKVKSLKVLKLIKNSTIN